MSCENFYNLPALLSGVSLPVSCLLGQDVRIWSEHNTAFIQATWLRVDDVDYSWIDIHCL